MKKILIVNNNLDMGGIQTSLINLLWEIHNAYDITLLLFSKSGALLKAVPENVKVISPCKCYSVLGLTKEELKKYPLLFLIKAFLLKYASVFSRRSAMKLLGVFQKRIKGYDSVISYSHLTNHKYFTNGCADFVLDKTVSNNKICLIHCDYFNSGSMTDKNNAQYAAFDRIACCSDSVKERFLQGSAMDRSKVYTLRNFFDATIEKKAADCPYIYDDSYINLVSVARVSAEKGIDRAITALANSKRTDIRYYVIGDGPKRNDLVSKVNAYGLKDQVFFLGVQENPYRYMVNADYLLVPSVHEAAPMVFDEAKILGLPVLTTNTTSAMEMVGTEHGRVFDNSQEGIVSVLSELSKGVSKKHLPRTNELQREQFVKLIY